VLSGALSAVILPSQIPQILGFETKKTVTWQQFVSHIHCLMLIFIGIENPSEALGIVVGMDLYNQFCNIVWTDKDVCGFCRLGISSSDCCSSCHRTHEWQLYHEIWTTKVSNVWISRQCFLISTINE
jgi:hypothetical protein